MSGQGATIPLSIDDTRFKTGARNIVQSLQEIRNEGVKSFKDVGEAAEQAAGKTRGAGESNQKTETSYRQLALRITGATIAVHGLNQGYDSLEKKQFQIARTQNDIRDSMNKIAELQREHKTNTYEYTKAVSDLNEKQERLRMLSGDVQQAQFQMGLSMVTLATSVIPSLITALKGAELSLHGIRAALTAIATHPAFLIAAAGIAAWELAIAPLIKQYNGLDLSITGNLSKLMGFNQHIETTTTNTHALVQENAELDKSYKVLSSGGMLQMTKVYDDYNSKLKQNIDLQRQQAQVSAQNFDNLKKNQGSVLEYQGQVNQAINDTIALNQWASTTWRLATGRVPEDLIGNGYRFPNIPVNDPMQAMKYGADLVSVWRQINAKAGASPIQFPGSVNFPGSGDIPVTMREIKKRADEARKAMLDELNATIRYTQQQLDVSLMLRYKEQQRQILESLSGVEYEILYNRILRQALQAGATVEEAQRIADDTATGYMEDKIGERTRLARLGLSGANNSLGGAGGVLNMAQRGQTGAQLASMFHVGTLSEISANMALTFANLGRNTLADIRSGKLNVAGTGFASPTSRGGISVGRQTIGTPGASASSARGRGKSARHGGGDKGHGRWVEQIQKQNEALRALAAEYSEFNISAPQYPLSVYVGGRGNGMASTFFAPANYQAAVNANFQAAMEKFNAEIAAAKAARAARLVEAQAIAGYSPYFTPDEILAGYGGLRSRTSLAPAHNKVRALGQAIEFFFPNLDQSYGFTSGLSLKDFLYKDNMVDTEALRQLNDIMAFKNLDRYALVGTG